MLETAGSDQVVDCLVTTYRSVLEVEDVDADSDFFELGGHSVLAGRVVAQVRDQLGIPVSLRDVFTARTPRGISEAVSGRDPLPH
ncbi:phosphopantetheine-binding protein [Nocardioides sp. InS609-2]|uniref:phosphopantetheine-binding protein n=1 Tax=Nocardioides sp. InS609-2 TaxID=2760705 RepID=UPI0020C01386|nr:phosphopantetheine-binding protein [Nocardioides sp. InS609-2]